MKTIKTTFALLFAAVSFTACTNQAIEPMRPVTQSQAIVARPDTTGTLTRNVMEDDEQPAKPQHGKVTTTLEPARSSNQVEIIFDPTPRPMPKPVVKSQPKPDTLAY